MNQTIEWYLRLILTKGLGNITVKKLLDFYGSIELLFEEKTLGELEKKWHLSSKIVAELRYPSEKNRILLEREWAFMQTQKIDFIGYLDEGYPKRLKNCDDAPIGLFVRGDFRLFEEKCVAVVGTRRASSYGLAFVKSFVEEIASFSPVIASGLAYGIDVQAHRAALDAGLPTFAVLGTSFKNIYPKRHLEISKEIEQNGLLVSEYPSWSKSIPEFFIRRNRIVAGLSEAVVVVESPLKGGSLSTAVFANDYSREVFALPGRINDALSAGCLHLIQKNLAQVFISCSDFASELNWSLETTMTQPAKNEPTDVKKKINYEELSEKEQRIVRVLEEQGNVHVDTLCHETQLQVSELNSMLMMLEIQGITKSLPGKIVGLE